jgi:hypothetical protein
VKNNSTGPVSCNTVWDNTPVEKHKERMKNLKVDRRISPLMEPCRACTGRETQQQEHGTQPIHGGTAVVKRLYSGFSSPGVGGAGEICILLT